MMDGFYAFSCNSPNLVSVVYQDHWCYRSGSGIQCLLTSRFEINIPDQKNPKIVSKLSDTSILWCGFGSGIFLMGSEMEKFGSVKIPDLQYFWCVSLTICCRTGTVTNYGSGTGTRYKIMYSIIFHKKFFHSHFTINLLKLIIFFLVKQLTM
jgi:hypothetical protein